MLAFAARRLILLPFQALGVVTIVFVLVHLLPGDPAYLIAGPQATASQVSQIRKSMGLNRPLPAQYATYVSNVAHGDLGSSWYTGNAVTTDIRERAPATLELITLALLGIIIFGLLITGLTVFNPRGIGGRILAAYGFVAGALPDFWVGLALIFLLYYKVRVGAAPSGQLGSQYSIHTRTGIATLDALIAHNGGAFVDAVNHLILPVVTLIFVYMGPVVRVTGVAGVRSLHSDFIEYASSWGIAPWRRMYYALRSALPVFVIAVASAYGYLLGGAVLVETVFSWGGFGQYAVQSVTHSDYAAIEGFVIIAGTFTVLVYTVSDLLQMALDPRTRQR